MSVTPITVVSVSQQQHDDNGALSAELGATDNVLGFSRSLRDPRWVWTKLPTAKFSVRSAEALANTHQVQEFKLSWSNLTFSLPANQKNKASGARHVILKNVSGRCGAGELTAVMGPSGCGKTTLLDILADRVCSGQIDGRIELNGAKRETRTFRAVARYVAQEDTLLGSFTVLETLEMAAKLSLPSSITDATIRERVQTVLDDMGLRNCMHTLVGDMFRKGISGGQKRRLSMAIELLSEPSILLLDEPTSGLDSSSTFSIMKLVQRLCQEQGKTVICTIHQPSSLVYDMFTNIVILSAGETVYCGPRVDMIAHFASAGYACPAYSNPVEHFIELVNADFPRHGDIPKLLSAYTTSAIAAFIVNQIYLDRAQLLVTKSSAAASSTTALPSPWSQLWVILRRNSLNNLRNPGIFWMRLVINSVLAVMVGTMYLSTNSKISDTDISILLFGGHAFLVMLTIAVVPFFIEERAVFLRERLNSSLNVLSYVVANYLAALPGILTIAVTASLLIVYLVGLKSYWWFLLNLFLSMLAAESLMRVIGAASPHGIIGLAIGASVFGVFMVCEGFMIPAHAIPVYWLWGHYLAFHTYAYEAFMYKQFMPELGSDEPIPLILQRMRMTEVHVERNMAILLGYSLGLEVVFIAILYIVHTGRR